MTALVSSRVAHQSGGVYFLRIEDTDKKREQDRSVEQIVQNLNTFDLTPDEGIVQIDPLVEVGDYGPYIQSERVAIYETFAKDMVARGYAYPASARRQNSTNCARSRRRRASSPAITANGRNGAMRRWNRLRRSLTRASAR